MSQETLTNRDELLLNDSAYAEVKERFVRWREEREGGGSKRIPAELWESATELALVYGVGATVRAFNLDHSRLKRRVEGRREMRSEVADSSVPGQFKKGISSGFKFVEPSSFGNAGLGSCGVGVK